MVSEDHASYEDLTSSESASPAQEFYARFAEQIVFSNPNEARLVNKVEQPVQQNAVFSLENSSSDDSNNTGQMKKASIQQSAANYIQSTVEIDCILCSSL